MAKTSKQIITDLFPDTNVDYWAGQLEAGQDLDSLFKNMMGMTGESATANAGAVTDQLMNAFGGNPEDKGYWTGQIGKGVLEEPGGFETLLKNMSHWESPGLTNEPAGGGGTGGGTGGGGGEINLDNLGLPTVDKEFSQTLETLTGMLPQYQKSMDFLSDLPQMIDDWARDEVLRTRVKGDDINLALSQAANMRSGRGIMGGTESDNLRAKLLGQVRDRVENKRSQTLRDAVMAKASAGPAISQEMGRSAALLSAMFGTSAEANINVGNLIARMMEAGYTG